MNKSICSGLVSSDVLIIDNVNERSGAPIALTQVFRPTLFTIACIRAHPNRLYVESINGLVSKHPLLYLVALPILLFKLALRSLHKKPELLISNTVLTSPISLYFFLRGVRVITWIHETPQKSLLYKFSFWLSLRISNTIVTPSRSVFLPYITKSCNWTVIPNLVSPKYTSNSSSITCDDELHVLFLGGKRSVKGYDQYLRIKSLVHHLGLDKKIIFTDNLIANFDVVPYHENDILLVLTDNRKWRETFGLVGLEAAASGCIPLFTDSYAYHEIWQDFPELSLTGLSDQFIVSQLLFLSSNHSFLNQLKSSCQSYANTFADPSRVLSLWSKVIHGIPQH